MAYFENPDNITGIVELVQYVDRTTNVDGMGNMLGIVLLLILGGVSFLTSKAFFTLDRAALSTMFLVMIIAIFLFVLELLSVTILVIVVVLFIISLVINSFQGGGPA